MFISSIAYTNDSYSSFNNTMNTYKCQLASNNNNINGNDINNNNINHQYNVNININN